MVDEERILDLLDEYFTIKGQAEIQSDGSVNVDGDVTYRKRHPSGKIPVKFEMVLGVFKAVQKGLTSLINVPVSCFKCEVHSNKLTNLDHAPVVVTILDISNNLLTNLDNIPDHADVIATGNPLKTLKHIPQEDIPYLKITYNAELPLLRLLNVEKVFIASPEGGYMKWTPFEPVNTIINKYTGQGKSGAIKCAAELVRAGFKDNARW